jgi:hypothetical protein
MCSHLLALLLNLPSLVPVKNGNPKNSYIPENLKKPYWFLKPNVGPLT